MLIADDEALMRAGIRLILENDDEIRIVAEAQDAREAVEACRAHPVDVALLDIRMPGDGIAGAAEIVRHSPRTRVVMLTAFGEELSVTRALRAGAHGYLLKDTGPRDLIDAVRRAAAENLSSPRRSPANSSISGPGRATTATPRHVGSRP